MSAPPPPARSSTVAADDAVARAERLIAAEPSLFGTTRRDAKLAAEIMSGWVTVPPHDKLALPEDPDWNEHSDADANWQVRYLALTWLDPLRREGVRHDNREMLARYEFLLRDFAEDNPSLEEGRSAWTWYDHPTGHRSSVFAAAVSVLGLPEWLVQAMETHAAVISRDDQYRGYGNHSLMQNSGLLSIGAVLGRQEFIDLAMERSEALLLQSIDSQGVTDEGSYPYQWSNYNWWSEMRGKVEACEVPVPRTWARIGLMPEFIAHSTQPTGRATPFGDANVGAGGTKVSVKTKVTTAFFSRGYMFTRSGWGTDRPEEEESMVSLRYGQAFEEQPHGHMDAGNIEFFAFGTPLITDSGMYAYSAGKWRNWVKSPVAHNVITAEGAAYRGDRLTPLIFRRSASTHTMVTVWSTVIDGAVWRRTLLYSKLGHWVLVDDHVQQTHERLLTQRWNLPMDGQYEITDRVRIDQVGAEGPSLSIVWLAGAPAIRICEGWEPPEQPYAVGWRSREYGAIEPAPTAEARMETAIWHATTLLAARPAGAGPETVEVSDLHVTNISAGATITTPHGTEAVYLEPDGFTAESR